MKNGRRIIQFFQVYTWLNSDDINNDDQKSALACFAELLPLQGKLQAGIVVTLRHRPGERNLNLLFVGNYGRASCIENWNLVSFMMLKGVTKYYTESLQIKI